jgi:hypothetical protein
MRLSLAGEKGDAGSDGAASGGAVHGQARIKQEIQAFKASISPWAGLAIGNFPVLRPVLVDVPQRTTVGGHERVEAPV